jgi:hypothetical protein
VWWGGGKDFIAKGVSTQCTLRPASRRRNLSWSSLIIWGETVFHQLSRDSISSSLVHVFKISVVYDFFIFPCDFFSFNSGRPLRAAEPRRRSRHDGRELRCMERLPSAAAAALPLPRYVQGDPLEGAAAAKEEDMPLAARSGSGAGGPVQLTSLPPEVLFLIAHHLDPVLQPTYPPACAVTAVHGLCACMSACSGHGTTELTFRTTTSVSPTSVVTLRESRQTSGLWARPTTHSSGWRTTTTSGTPSIAEGAGRTECCTRSKLTRAQAHIRLLPLACLSI